MISSSVPQRRRFQIPRQDGSILCLPEWARWSELLERNRRASREANANVGGLPLAELRSLARRECLSASTSYLESFPGSPLGLAPALDPGTTASPGDDGPLIATGHQPTLFHPGVWIKSFAVAAMAAQSGGRGLHLLIDNDTCKRVAIPVPSGEPAAPLVRFIPFDRWASEVPFEDRCVLDEDVFRSFGGAVEHEMRSFGFEPVVREYWDAVLAAAPATVNLGERLAAGRRALEERMGCRNLELPMSRICQGQAFRWLTAELIVRREELAEIHNAALAEYRRVNRIRSRHHPFPELERDETWCELPLWAWSAHEPRRSRVFARQSGGGMELRAGHETIAAMPRTNLSSDLGPLVEILGRGLGPWKLRPRALATTLFLRLLVADLFVHGVGGAKYDELTDAIIRQFFGIDPPSLTVISATAVLPIRVPFDDAQLKSLCRQERDSFWNPERYIDDWLRDQDPLAEWIERKHELREPMDGTRQDRAARFREFRELNEKLRHYLGPSLEEWRRRREALDAARAAADLLGSREFSFCLHPAESIQRLLEQVGGAGR